MEVIDADCAALAETTVFLSYFKDMHWVMDMAFRDDQCRVRAESAPANFVTHKHIADNLIRKAPGKDSQRLKRMTAAWDDDFLASLVAA